MNKKSRSTPNPFPEMTRKEALAVVHKVYEAEGFRIFKSDASKEEKALQDQIHKAFTVLDVAIHGAGARYSSLGLCAFCFLRLSHGVCVLVKGDYIRRPCCTVCRKQLHAEQKLESVEGEKEEGGQTC